MHARRALMLAGLIVLTVGCADSPRKAPASYPVTGTVIKKGGQALNGGTIRFQSNSPSDLTTTGEIGPDGAFSLTTLAPGGVRAAGAPEGQYTVSVMAPLGADRNAPVLVVTEPLVTVKADSTNQFSIEVVESR